MKYTIKDFRKQFPSPDSCIDYVFKYRFGDNFICPLCEDNRWYRISGRKAYASPCGFQVSPLAGTIFHKSDTDLTLWFFAIYKFANSRNGVSAKELERDLGVTYKTAWRIAKQIRALMKMDNYLVTGTIEVDEAFIRTGTGRYGKGLSKAAAIIERGGKAKAFDMANVSFPGPVNLIKKEVEPGSKVMTDGDSAYKPYWKFLGYKHDSVNHSAKEFARGEVHINTVEGFFSQIKRSIDGTYHRVSEKHLQSYLDEFSWRLSYSRSGFPLFLLLLKRLCQLPYEVK